MLNNCYLKAIKAIKLYALNSSFLSNQPKNYLFFGKARNLIEIK